MGRKKKRRGKRRVKKKGIKAGAEAEVETQANPSSPNIPEEVVVEILSRLPLRSLPRFTCVSKQWRSLVPDIIAKGTGKKMVLVRSILRSGTLMHSMDEESRVEQVTTPFDQMIKSKYYPVLYGSCNGLLLIRIDDDLFLWNPVTRYSKKVLSHESLADDSYIVGSLGLCHDSSTNEYKAIMALYHESPDYRCDQFVNVGSFRCKNWTRVRFPYKVHTVGSGPVVNGHLHWYVSDENSGHFLSSHQILYFNPHTNQFSKVPMPEPKNRLDGNMILGLGVLEGCLSMVHHDGPNYSKADSVEVLAMKEYGLQKSWTKLFSISNLAFGCCDKLEPLCYTKDGEALMFTSISSESVRAYDPIDSSYKEILVQPNCDSVHAIMYEESLDTPTDYDWEEEEKKGEPAYVQYYSYRGPCKWTKKGMVGAWHRLEIEEKDYKQPNTQMNIDNPQNVLESNSQKSNGVRV